VDSFHFSVLNALLEERCIRRARPVLGLQPNCHHAAIASAASPPSASVCLGQAARARAAVVGWRNRQPVARDPWLDGLLARRHVNSLPWRSSTRALASRERAGALISLTSHPQGVAQSFDSNRQPTRVPSGWGGS
jgi:hypothetical protein